VERRGGDDPLVIRVLAGKNPQERAAELLAGTNLASVDARKKLAAGGTAAIASSDDPMIELAKTFEPEARRLREINDELAEMERQAYAKITEAMFAFKGTDVYPDATFTLRLAFGVVASYREGSSTIPPWTTIDGAFQHEKQHGAKDPWVLPPSWHQHRERLAGETPFNFVCTADIIGGNSGSPVINREAELVGVIFDGNIQSLTGNYFYSDKVARAVSVHSSVIREAIRKVYGAGKLADELGK
jgi:hypothetical protein